MYVPAVVGVPLTSRSKARKLRPGGNPPMVYVSGELPPVATGVPTPTGIPTCPVLLEIVGAVGIKSGVIVQVNVRVAVAPTLSVTV